jgi:hypothetical protein
MLYSVEQFHVFRVTEPRVTIQIYFIMLIFNEFWSYSRLLIATHHFTLTNTTGHYILKTVPVLYGFKPEGRRFESQTR